MGPQEMEAVKALVGLAVIVSFGSTFVQMARQLVRARQENAALQTHVLEVERKLEQAKAFVLGTCWKK